MLFNILMSLEMKKARPICSADSSSRMKRKKKYSFGRLGKSLVLYTSRGFARYGWKHCHHRGCYVLLRPTPVYRMACEQTDEDTQIIYALHACNAAWSGRSLSLSLTLQLKSADNNSKLSVRWSIVYLNILCCVCCRDAQLRCNKMLWTTQTSVKMVPLQSMLGEVGWTAN